MAVTENVEKETKKTISSEQYDEVKKENAELRSQITKLNEAVNKLYSLYVDILNKYLNN